MKKILLGAFAALACFALASCGDDDGVKPSTGLLNLTTEARAGYAVIRWDSLSTETSNIRYIKFLYHDPLLGQDVMKTASVYADSILIPDMRKKYGDYAVTIIPVSPTGGEGSPQSITISSLAAPITYTPTGEYALTAAMLSTNQQEPTEGPIANLVDGNNSTFFHSTWSTSVTGSPYIQIEFPEVQTACVGWGFVTRNKNNVPKTVELKGSLDGSTWFDIYTYTTADGLPANQAAVSNTNTSYRLGPTLLPADHQSAKYFRLVVTETNTGTVFFSMAELKWYTYTVYDPEA